MIIERQWAMPSRWTFTIKPIRALLDREVKGYWIDPFCGKNSPAAITNDLNPDIEADFHLTANQFLRSIVSRSVDGVLFDPPYSPRQIKECYDGIGLKLAQKDTQQTFWASCKDEIARVLVPGGKAICFGWGSNGIGMCRGFAMQRVLIVPHGGTRNDTIVTVETKNL